jgi:hypothetical protein
LIEQSIPFAFIPDEIRSWITRGWRFGKLEDSYVEHEPDDELEAEDSSGDQIDDEWDESEKMASMNSRSRPRSFNRVMRAIVREMARLYNNWPIAYAIDKTKRFFSEEELKTRDSSKAKDKFKQAYMEFHALPDEDKLKWQARVIRRGPRLDRIVAED